MHGMGDAAHNEGMVKVQEALASKYKTYVANIQIGHTRAQDMENSYFLTMNKQVQAFAAAVANDSKLHNGFNAIGFSQGNLIIRAYIERFNQPQVYRFLSIHGPHAGVGALPQCRPSEIYCKVINEALSNFVYSEDTQEHIAQSNYFRDPMRIPEYLEHAQFLPDINNERQAKNGTYRRNFGSLETLVLVRAKHDTMVFPSFSEWFGVYATGSYSHVLPYNETSWYLQDTFGLRTLIDSHRVYFEETNGNHMDFTLTQLFEFVSRYF